MTKQLWTVVVFAIAAGGVRAEEKPAFKNDNEKFSYAQTGVGDGLRKVLC